MDDEAKVVSIFDKRPISGAENEHLEADRADTIRALKHAIELVEAGEMVGCVIVGGKFCPVDNTMFGAEIIISESPVSMAPFTFHGGCSLAARNILDQIEQTFSGSGE